MRAATFLVLTLATFSASADYFMSGNTLLTKLKDTPLLALGYVIGIADANDSRRTESGCFNLPRGITQGQTRDIVKNWLEAHPEHRHYSGNSLVISALAEAWPCSSK